MELRSGILFERPSNKYFYLTLQIYKQKTFIDYERFFKQNKNNLYREKVWNLLRKKLRLENFNKT